MYRRTFVHAVQLALLTSPLGVHAIGAQAGPRAGSESSAALGELTAANAQADFDILRRALEEAHGALYRFTTKGKLDRRFDGYRARLDRPIAKIAFIGLLSEMLAEFGDGHTRLEADEATTAAVANAPVFPLRVRMEGSRLVVIYNDTPSDSTIRPGMEVLSINGRPTSEVIALILPKVPGDGFIETGKKTRLARAFGRNYWVFVDQAQEFTIVARDPAGRAVTVTLPGVLEGDRTRNSNPVNAEMQAIETRLDGPKDNVSLRFVSDPDIASLRIRSFGGDDYPVLIEAAFRSLREKGTEALILDLRGNGGGVDQYGALLVSQFTDKPFRYFDRIHVKTIRPSFATWKPSTFDDLREGVVADPTGGYLVTAKLHSGVAEQSPATTPFLGKAFVLMDGGTFSTSADVTATLHHLKRATFIGEESAGTYEGNTSGLNALVTLPNSKLGLKVQMYGYWNAVSPGTKGRGTLPDHVVERRTADVLRGVDAQWDRAVELARAAALAASDRPR